MQRLRAKATISAIYYLHNNLGPYLPLKNGDNIDLTGLPQEVYETIHKLINIVTVIAETLNNTALSLTLLVI